MTDVLLWLISGANLAIVALYLNLHFAWRRRMKREQQQFAEMTLAVERLVNRYEAVLTLTDEPAMRGRIVRELYDKVAQELHRTGTNGRAQ